MATSGYEVITCDVEHLGSTRTVKMLRDPVSLVPYFPASIWLMHQYSRKPSGYDQLAQHIAAFLNFAQSKGWSPLEVTSAELEAYCDKYLFKEKRLAATTIKLYYTSIVQFYRGMEKLGFVQKAIEIENFSNLDLQGDINFAEGQRRSLDPFDLYKKYLDDGDFQALAGSVPTKKARLRKRDELILRVAYETGCRAAEIVDPDNFSIRRLREGLRAAEQKGDREFLHSIIGKGRGAGKPRKIAIPTSLADSILRYVRDHKIRGDIAFCNDSYGPLHRTHASKLFKRCKDVLLESSSDSTPNLDLWIRHADSRTFHGLRHTYATNLAHKLRRLGETFELLRERMGHASIETTMVYINFDILRHGTAEEQNEALAERGASSISRSHCEEEEA